MEVRDIIEIRNTRTGNREKALMIAKLLKARARRNNPTDTETPSGWNASPYPGSLVKPGGAQT